MEATLSTEDKVFLATLSDEDRRKSACATMAMLERTSCGLDTCEFLFSWLDQLRNAVYRQFVEDRSREPHAVAIWSLDQIDTFIRYVEEDYDVIMQQHQHYSRLHNVLRQKETIDRINRNAGIGTN